MKILIYCYPTIGQRVGGLQNQIANTLSALVKQHIDAKLFDAWNDKLDDCDILHVFSLTDFSSLNLIKLAKSKGKKVIISSVYNTTSSRLSEKIKIQVSKRYNWLCTLNHHNYEKMRIADAVIALSNKEKDHLLDVYPEAKDKIRIVGNGINQAFLQDNENHNNAFVEKYLTRDYVLCVGQIYPNKNQLTIIKSIRNTDVKLVIIGQVLDVDYYKLCRAAATENVLFIDPLPYDSPLLIDAYWGARVFALPSYHEVMPLTAIEAAATNNHLILTNNSHLGNTIDCFNPAFVSPDDLQGLRKLILDRIKRPVSYEPALKKAFSWDEVAEKLIAIYTDVLR
ncbi:MAG: glycosyltransferase family 4 protein [Proteobacteria bacterium]|nr:glycosyltransferase family 4 protein [Pseudomonadota bacterium]MBU4011645.1 glycosyltransferase family 4 protein [Pseudomonadota bacterium]